MGVVRLSNAGIRDFQKTDSALAGNDAFSPGDYELLEAVELSSSSSSVTFSSLNSTYGSTYKHLQLRWTARNAATSVDGLRVRFNGQTNTASYYWHALRGQAGTIQSYDSSTTSSLEIGATPHSNDTAGIFAGGITNILDAFNSSKNTTIKTSAALNAGLSYTRLHSGLFVDNSAIDSIDIFGLNGSNLASGSRFSLYGLRAGA